MYFNFKSKYKKIFWLLLGFCVACMFTSKAKAFSIDYHGITINSSLISNIWSQLEGKTSSQFPNTNLNDTVHVWYEVDYPKISITKKRNNNNILYITFIHDCDGGINGDYLTTADLYGSISCRSYWNPDGNSYGGYSFLEVLYNVSTNTIQSYNSPFSNFKNIWWQYSSKNMNQYEPSATSWDISFTAGGQNRTLSKSFDYVYNPLPDYLSGYTEITLEPGERYIMFSSSTITSGSVYIPLSDFNNYGSRISYFDKDIEIQPYTSYIQDFTITPDDLYARQYFDLSSYSGSDFIMFSKYIYLEGDDNFSSSIWVPSAMYSSIVEITPNDSGGNDFDFSYVDSNGDLQADVISSVDFSQSSPLVSDLFTNFTTRDYGLSSIITAPIPLLQSLNNATCTNIQLPLGVFGGRHDEKITLPCMTSIYTSAFGDLFELYQTITTGFIAYWVGLAYFNKIKQLKDPYNDRIEVVNL